MSFENLLTSRKKNLNFKKLEEVMCQGLKIPVTGESDSGKWGQGQIHFLNFILKYYED